MLSSHSVDVFSFLGLVTGRRPCDPDPRSQRHPAPDPLSPSPPHPEVQFPVAAHRRAGDRSQGQVRQKSTDHQTLPGQTECPRAEAAGEERHRVSGRTPGATSGSDVEQRAFI